MSDIKQAEPAVSSGSKIWTAPKWVNTFYAKFPLVWLEQEDEIDWRKQSDPDVADCSLWVRSGSSISFSCLRTNFPCRYTQAHPRHIRITESGHHRTHRHSELNYFSYFVIQLSGSLSNHGRTKTRHPMELFPHFTLLPTRL